MNVITDTFRGLVRRKLWPLAVVLVGALVAVPMLLAKDPVTASVSAPHTKAEEGMPATFVSASDTDGAVLDGKRRRVLGQSKDPFAPRELSKAEKAARRKAAKKAADALKAAKSATASSAKDTTTSKSSSGSGGGGGGSSADTPAPAATPTPAPKTYPLYSVKVSFGKVDGEQATKTIERLKVLPNTVNPLLVYRGVEEGGKVAVFELTDSVVAQGDGKCEPSPDDCQILKLREDETEFITVSDTGDETDAQYQLQVEKIHAGTTTSQADLKKASSAGRELLGALGGDHSAHYAFDSSTGTLRKVDAKSASKLTRAARRASW